MRVVVETPNGSQITGEAVSEGFIKKLIGTERLGSGHVVGGRITHGEATVVDLGRGRYLFALLGTADESWYLPFYTFVEEFPKGYPNDDKKTYVDAAHEFVQVKGPRPVPPQKYPSLVTFTDINDPKSAKEVDPNNLAATFGAGYSLKSITLEITDEAATDGVVQEILPWIGDATVMENPGWKSLPIFNRETISQLLTDFRKAQARFGEEQPK
ncbi:MAG: hypothetical protein H7X89_00165 [Rhizobiales bacterium]|nr:hypothetical protein [Hyphomicrobiales bacterium]